MSGWTVPLSSSPMGPSTPGTNEQRKIFFANGLTATPSTTPAGPPPSSVRSFTPADPPPTSIFGSSQIGSGKTLFKQKKSAAANTGSQRRLKFPARKTIDETKLARYMDRSGSFDLGSSNGLSSNISFGLPSNNPLSRFAIDNEVDENEEEDQTGVEDSDYYEDYGEGTDAEGSGEEDENMNVDLAADDGLPDLGSITNPLSYGSMANGDLVEAGSSIHNETPRGMKRSRGGAVLPYTPPRILRKQRKSRQESVLPSIAKNMASKMGMRRLDEPEDFIVGTEDIIRQELIGAGALIGSHEDSSQLSLPKASERLCDYWRSCRDRDEANAPLLQDAMLGIGPDENALSMHKAAFVAGLLLQLRHPPTAKGKQALAISRLNRSSSKSLFRHTQIPSNPTVYPKVLLDWLEKNHNPYQATVDEVQNYRPSPTAHYNYWDIIFSSTLRGKLALVVRMFKRSNFHHARTAREDGLGSEGYHGIQVSNIENVINRAVQVLELCPGLQDDDWNVTANEWVIFRKRIEQAMEDLTIFAEGQDRDQFRAPTFEAANFGLRSTTMSLSQSSRKAESKVPWTIYQNLKVVYGILLGGTTEILSSAQDWVEGTIGLTVWWDGNGDEGVAVGSLAMTEHSLRQSHSRGAPAVDAEVNSGSLYLGRLAYAFACATDESDDKLFQINPMNAVEVGLASVFEGNISSVMSLLQAWSLPVASAVAELGSIGGWFKTPAVNLMVLDDDVETVLDRPVHQESLMTKDTILTEYAEALSEKGSVRGQRGTSYGGWELAISLLSRLDDQSSGRRSAGKILDRLPLNSDARIDKILETCQRLHMTEEARGITERYADYLVEHSEDYGTALIYYARAHRERKVKDILNLLISLSLVESVAFPPLSALDHNHHALLFTPQESLSQLALIDPHAAETLHTHLTGYATLRKFYDLRDEEVNQEGGQKPTLRLHARKRAAAQALLAVINSASDNISGGLLDRNRGSVVQIDGLLALLGEALVFVNQTKSVLSLPQCLSLLKGIEDLQTVASRVRAQCEECFRSTLAAYQGHTSPASPRGLLKKSMSSLTSASSFSLVGSSMFDSESSNDAANSKALVQSREVRKRGWDWREGLSRDAKGDDVLRILRLGLAQDIARHWMNGAMNNT